jgi:hypothetical protein
MTLKAMIVRQTERSAKQYVQVSVPQTTPPDDGVWGNASRLAGDWLALVVYAA